jgi:hypothetical protein
MTPNSNGYPVYIYISFDHLPLSQLIYHYAQTLLPVYTLQRHNNENSKQIFPGKELRGYSPNSYIHVSVSDLYIPLIGLPVLLKDNRWAERGNV